jgi:GNAT superfamily N-acetyltransferase
LVDEKIEVLIRPFRPDDTRPINELLRESWSHHPTILNVYRVHRNWHSSDLVRRTLVATVSGAVAGVGTIFESTLHPRKLIVTINVAEGWRRRGVGSALFESLERLSDNRPWLTKVTRRDRAGMAFLEKRGFRPVVSTLIGVLDPSLATVRAWMAGLPTSVPGFRVLPLDDPGCKASLAEVALVHAAIYRQFHTWNLPVEENVEAAINHYCGPDTIVGSHLCAYQNDQLVGAANLFQSDVGEAYLGNVGVVGTERPGAGDLTAVLIRRSLELAAYRGLRVRFEADDTYTPHRALLEGAPVTDSDCDLAIMANG